MKKGKANLLYRRKVHGRAETSDFFTLFPEVVGARRVPRVSGDEVARITEAQLLSKVAVELAIVLAFFPSRFLGVLVGLMDEEVVREDPVVDAGQVNLVQTGGLVGAVADEALVAPGRAFALVDDVGLVREIVVLDWVQRVALVPPGVIGRSVAFEPRFVEHVETARFNLLQQAVLVCRERVPILAVRAMHVFKGRYHKCCSARRQHRHRFRAATDRIPKVGAQVEIDVEHHDVVSAGKELGYVPPHIELAVKGIQDQVNVHIILHVWVACIHLMQLVQHLFLRLVVIHMNRSRNRSYPDGMLIQPSCSEQEHKEVTSYLGNGWPDG